MKVDERDNRVRSEVAGQMRNRRIAVDPIPRTRAREIVARLIKSELHSTSVYTPTGIRWGSTSITASRIGCTRCVRHAARHGRFGFPRSLVHGLRNLYV